MNLELLKVWNNAANFSDTAISSKCIFIGTNVNKNENYNTKNSLTVEKGIWWAKESRNVFIPLE